MAIATEKSEELHIIMRRPTATQQSITERTLTSPDTRLSIKEMPIPTDVTGAHRLNGFVNYAKKILPGLSDVMEPIRQLTKKNVPWNWSNT